ncbi:hypothetical protein HWQ46_06410 [Shewanella sp. D64]|uniref:hypothetical protein n=1 Tax=unclassified Shewanella TaxID=196818 RepID=UPI0022BA2EEE|nr:MULTISPECIES: hypothetical protein [unclassified Shewanella]MEC4725184.1 hypothetical protein [Shewanella sp. D64]MEC4737085.1 hypothetical protein [Shewanella sp. E94]WBJ96670.1 hypothetical protein HWQ47_06015 [Shewanella sp. MTB7]
MGPFEIAAIAIIGAFSVSAYKEYNKRKGSVDSSDMDELKAELVKLQDRVATLETIVTDKSYQLNQQINSL